MIHKRTLRGVLVIGAALGLLAAGCGDDDDDADDTQPAETDAPAETEAPVDETDAPAETEAPVDETDPPADDAAGGDAFEIVNFAFSGPTEVAAGTTLTVTNSDGAPHTLTADDGSFDTGTIDGGGSGELTLDTAGEFAFHCNIHPSMTGSITVT